MVQLPTLSPERITNTADEYPRKHNVRDGGQPTNMVILLQHDKGIRAASQQRLWHGDRNKMSGISYTSDALFD